MKKKWMSGALALLLAGTTVASMTPAVAVNAEGQNTATGTTYYVDSENGNADKNATGTSKDDAFKTLAQVNAVILNREIRYFLRKDLSSMDRHFILRRRTAVVQLPRLLSRLMEMRTQPDHRSIQMVRVAGI